MNLETPAETTPLALIQGEPLKELPQDLYIPPDALEVFLDTFEGPLDILLYLIKKQNMDILNIPIAEITRQYIKYVELMKEIKLELAAEYLVMAAMLAEIKSRMLLPRSTENLDDDEDPRAELIRRLQEYERFKTAAEDMEQLPRMGRDTFIAQIDHSECQSQVSYPDVSLAEILQAMQEVMKRADMFTHHHVQKEQLSVRERMGLVLEKVNQHNFIDFHTLFSLEEGRAGVVVTFLAILELVKISLIEIVQAEPYRNIHVKAVSQ